MTATAEPTTTTGTSPVVVASVPRSHVYVRHLDPVEPTGEVVRLDDPDPGDPRRPAGAQWWPPVMLDPAWVGTAEADLVHLQFGFDARSPEDLERWTQALRRRGIPLVYTVHDLRNPHHEDRTLHDAQLDVLVPAADALVTLTPGAADEIRRRWGREATVLPHPHVVDGGTVARVRAARAARDPEPFRVGVHVKSLRAGMAPHRVLPVLVETVAGLPGAVLQVNGHHDVLTPGGARFDAELSGFLHEQAEAERVDLRVHDFLPDDGLWDYLGSLDLSVLPYRFGTHSGWLEACRDLGTTVLAPTCGYLKEQGPVLTYVHQEDVFDADSLRRAVETAYAERPDLGAFWDERVRQRQEVADAHLRLYRGLT